jgi:hypothetical protein
MQSVSQVSMHKTAEIRVQERLLVPDNIAHLRTLQFLRDPRRPIVPPLQPLVHSEGTLRVLRNGPLRLRINNVRGVRLIFHGISSAAGFAWIWRRERPLNDLGSLEPLATHSVMSRHHALLVLLLSLVQACVAHSIP